MQRGRVIRCEDMMLLYTNVRELARTMSPVVKRTISAMYSMVDQHEFQDYDGLRYLRRWFDVDRNVIAHAREKEGPREGEFERAKVTSEHHTHFRPEEVWQELKNHIMSRRAASVVLEKLRKIEGITEATVSTFLLFMAYCRPQIAYLIAASRKIWEAKEITKLASTLKDVATPLKSMHNIEVCDYSEIFELQSLINRGVGVIDWDKERANRTTPDVIDVPAEKIYDEARKVFAIGVKHGYKYRRMNLDKYIEARWEWVPTGSIHSQYEADRQYIKKQYRHRNKFVSLNIMDANYIKDMFQRKPQIRAWASVKYEWAKKRAIYGVDVTSAVITNFAMFRCEEALRHRFPVGEEAAAKRVHKRLKMMLKDDESFCYDFDDFNAQHSTEAMYAVLCAYRDSFKDRMTEEQRVAMEWVCDSVLDVVVYNNEDRREEKYRVKGTLLSGWRLTTFINTVLNYIYFSLSGALNAEGVVDSVHNGDDVLLSIKNIKAAVTIHDKMSSINARAQATKCNVFSIGEFLRVEHKVTKEEGLGAQYLTRAMATLAHSRVESQEPVRITDAVKSMVTRCEEAAARSIKGAEVSKNLLDFAVGRYADIFRVEKKVVKEMVRSHVLVGGAITTKTGAIDQLVEEIVIYDEPDKERAKEEGIATVSELRPGIRDYRNVLFRQFGEYISLKKIGEAIESATRRQLSITRGTWLRVEDVSKNKRYGYGREMYGMYREIVNIPHIEKGRFVGVSPIAMLESGKTQLVKRLISGVKDVNYALKVLL
nr:replicase [Bursera graveolens associated totivirus 1]